MMKIREIQLDDTQAFLELNKQLDEETKFMMLEPGERDTSIDSPTHRIRGFIDKKNSTLFVAQSESRLIGYIAARGGPYQRNAHKANVVIGILQEHVGQGLGAKLFECMEEWARQIGLHRLELTVMTHNESGIALYKKRGFSIEGEIKHSLLIDGKFVDEYSMFKIINQEIAEQSAPEAAASGATEL